MSYLNSSKTIQLSKACKCSIYVSIHLRNNVPNTLPVRCNVCTLTLTYTLSHTLTHSHVLSISMENKLHILIFLWLPSFGFHPFSFVPFSVSLLLSTHLPHALVNAVFNPFFYVTTSFDRRSCGNLVLIRIGCFVLVFRLFFFSVWAINHTRLDEHSDERVHQTLRHRLMQNSLG